MIVSSRAASRQECVALTMVPRNGITCASTLRNRSSVLGHLTMTSCFLDNSMRADTCQPKHNNRKQMWVRIPVLFTRESGPAGEHRLCDTAFVAQFVRVRFGDNSTRPLRLSITANVGSNTGSVHGGGERTCHGFESHSTCGERACRDSPTLSH